MKEFRNHLLLSDRVFRIVAILLAICIASQTAFIAEGAGQKKKAASAASQRKAGAQTQREPLTEEQKIVHLLSRIGYGPTREQIERVKKMGIAAYLEEQLHPETIEDKKVVELLKPFNTLNLSPQELAQSYPPPQIVNRLRQIQEQRRSSQSEGGLMDGPNLPALPDPQQVIFELQQAKLIRAVYSERQLLEVMTDFWFNHFNVFAAKGADRWYISSYEREAIQPHALGKFKDLLMATAKSPAMLIYLDNWLSAQPGGRPPRPWRPSPELMRELGIQPQGQQSQMRPPQGLAPLLFAPPPPPPQTAGLNENYARELMELHTLGVDGGYTQKDVVEVARCFTGWSVLQPQNGGGFVFRPWAHDRGEKIVLGVKIPAGGGIEDGERVIDLLANHPSTARFISTKLLQRFVSDSPPQALIERIASVFTKSGGDIREVLRAIVMSPEFFSREAYRSKVKSPFELVASSIRALEAEVTPGPFPNPPQGPPLLPSPGQLPSPGPPQQQRPGQAPQQRPQQAQFLIGAIGRMGQPLYLCQPPTGYSENSQAWVNTGALLNRLNFATALASNRAPGVRIDYSRLLGDAATSSLEQVIDRLISVILKGDPSPQTGETLKNQVADSTNRVEGGKPASQADIARIAGLILGSPEFQKR